MKGYVYIISNKSIPNLFKIGYTDRDPETRAREMDSTGVPHPFVVEYEILLDNPRQVEQNTHLKLNSHNESKEWFRCSFAQCVQAIRECCSGTVYYEKCHKQEREAEVERAKEEIRRIKIEEKRAEQIINKQKAEIEAKEKEEKKRLEEYYKAHSTHRKNYSICFSVIVFSFFTYLNSPISTSIFFTAIFAMFFYWLCSGEIADWRMKNRKDIDKKQQTPQI